MHGCFVYVLSVHTLEPLLLINAILYIEETMFIYSNIESGFPNCKIPVNQAELSRENESCSYAFSGHSWSWKKSQALCSSYLWRLAPALDLGKSIN